MTSTRAYIAIAGAVFALTFAAHVARLFAEGIGILREPIPTSASVISLGLAVWAVVLLIRR